MIALPNQGYSANVLPLIRTLFDIVLLRKGPEDIPRSWFLFVLIVALWLFSSLAALALIEQFDETDFFLGLFSGFIGIVCYAALVMVSGWPGRVLQTISAILGSGALISLAFVAAYVLLSPLLGAESAANIATLVGLWSIVVEGNIIARAMERHWYIGILVAIAVFAFQLIIYSIMASTP